MRACFLASVVAAQTIVVSLAGPLKTLVEARDAARAQRRAGNTGPFTIRVSDGAHYLSDTLVLTPEDSVVRAELVRRHEEPRGSNPPHGSRDGTQNFDFVGYFN